MSVTREELLAEARTWIGVPWVHQGRNRFGVDCIGLLLVVGWKLGLSDYDVTGYGRVPNGDFMLRECARLLVPTAAERPGDVLLMRFKREPQHLAFVTDRGMLHAYAGAGRVVETTMPRQWRDRIVGVYSIPGVV